MVYTNLSPRWHMLCKLYFGEVPLANRFDQTVFANVGLF